MKDRKFVIVTSLFVLFGLAACHAHPHKDDDHDDHHELPAKGLASIHDGMEFLEEYEVLEFLENLAEGKLDGVNDTDVQDQALRAEKAMNKIDWAPLKKESGKEEYIEELSSQIAGNARKLAMAATKKQRNSYMALAEATVSRCFKCHINYRD